MLNILEKKPDKYVARFRENNEEESHIMQIMKNSAKDCNRYVSRCNGILVPKSYAVSIDNSVKERFFELYTVGCKKTLESDVEKTEILDYKFNMIFPDQEKYNHYQSLLSERYLMIEFMKDKNTFLKKGDIKVIPQITDNLEKIVKYVEKLPKKSLKDIEHETK